VLLEEEDLEEPLVQWENQETLDKMARTENLEYKECQDALDQLDNLEIRVQWEIRVQRDRQVFLDLQE